MTETTSAGMEGVDYSTLSNRELCAAILYDWQNPWFGAVPYLDAMSDMLLAGKDPVKDEYGAEYPGYVVHYFLGNAAQWKGAVARGVKAELRRRLGLGR